MDAKIIPLTGDMAFSFGCSPAVPCFNACCRDLNQALSPYDILRLKNGLGMRSDRFLARYTRQITGPETGLPVMVAEDPLTCVARGGGMAMEPVIEPGPSTRTECTCPMHPEIVRDHPGSCPRCGMALEPMEATGEDPFAEELALMRRHTIGFVFQSFQLLASLTALANVMLPLELHGRRDAAERAALLLDRVGLAERTTHYPRQLSGGEQQRVAIARAFASDPAILFADEPTGNLDATTGQRITDLLFELNREQGTTLIMVTHDPELGRRAKRQIQMLDGRIGSDSGKSA